LAAAIARPYAAVLLERAAGILVAREFDPNGHEAEVRSAADTIDGSIVIDTSALATLAGVRDLWTVFVSAFHRILSSDLQLADVHSAARRYEGQSELSVSLDAEGTQAIVLLDPKEHRERLLSEANWMFQVIQQSEQLPVRQLSIVPGAEISTHGAWMGSLEVAYQNKLTLWSDDQAVRRFARDSGITTFSTLALLDALLRVNRISRLDVDRYVDLCLATAVVDVEVSVAKLLSLIRDSSWVLGPLAASFQRPAFWSDSSKSLGIVRLVLESVATGARDQLNAWILFWTREAVHSLPANAERIAGLIVATGVSMGAGIAASVPILIDGARRIVSDSGSGGDPLPIAVSGVLTQLQQRMSSSDAAKTTAALFSSLDDADRQIVTKVIADPGR
jgi:hypothetical protein